MSQKAEADPQVTPSQGVLLLRTQPLHKISNTIFFACFYLYFTNQEILNLTDKMFWTGDQSM